MTSYTLEPTTSAFETLEMFGITDTIYIRAMMRACWLIMISTMVYGSPVPGLTTYLSTNTVATKKVKTKKPNIKHLMHPKNTELYKFAFEAISLVTKAFSSYLPIISYSCEKDTTSLRADRISSE